MPRKLNRRQLMTALGASAAASLTGCIGSGAPDTNPNDESGTTESTPATNTTADSIDNSNGTTTDDPTVVQPDGDGPVQRIEVGMTSDESPFRHDLEFLAQPTDDHPARLRVSLTNTANSKHIVETNNFGLPFPARVGKAVDGDATLVLSPDSDAERRDGCWREYPKTLPKIETETLAPGQTLSATYALVNDMDAATCWPSGRYRFSQRYTVDPEANAIEYDWGFTVSVGAPGEANNTPPGNPCIQQSGHCTIQNQMTGNISSTVTTGTTNTTKTNE